MAKRLSVNNSRSPETLLSQALEHYGQANFAQAWPLFEELEPLISHPQLTLCHGITAFHLGHTQKATRLLGQGLQESARPLDQELEAFFHLTGEVSLLKHWASSEWSNNSQYLFSWSEDPGRNWELERLGPENQPLSRKLSKSNLVLHPFYSLGGLRRVHLECLWADGYAQQSQIEAIVGRALDIFRRGLGRAFPQLTVSYRSVPQSVLEFDQGDFSSRIAMNGIGWLSETLADWRGPCKSGAFRVFLHRPSDQQYSWAYSSGVARHQGRLSLIQLGHLQDHQSLTLAHELGHLWLNLPDIGTDKPFDDPCSLMSGTWDLWCEATFIGAKMKATCLTSQQSHRAAHQGLRAEKRGEWKAACTYYQRAYRQDPWHLAAGLAFLRLARIEKRYQACHQVLRELWERFPIWEARLRILQAANRDDWDMGEPSESARFELARWYAGGGHLRRAYQMVPPGPCWEEPDMQAALALDSLRQHRLPLAEKRIRRAIKLAPRHGKLYEVLAMILIGSGRRAQALSNFRLAARLSNHRSFPRLYRYWLAIYDRKWDRVEAMARSFLKVHQNNPDCWNQLGLVQLRQSCLPEAQHSFRQTYQLQPRPYNHACLLTAQGEPELAKQEALKALKPRISRPFALELLAYLEPSEPVWRERLARMLPAYVPTLWDW